MLVTDAITLESELLIEATAELAEEGACEMLGKDSVGASDSVVGSSEMLGKLSVGACVRDGPVRCQK